MTCPYVHHSDEGTAYCGLAQEQLDKQVASERAWLSWLSGICVDEDWQAIRPAIARRVAGVDR